MDGEVDNAFRKSELPTKVGFWTKFKSFWLKEIKVELTPGQQNFENKMNKFLYQEITREKLHDFLLQEVHIFGKKN